MVKDFRDIPKYREYRNEHNESFVTDENGEIDYTKKIVDIKTGRQADGYKDKLIRMESDSFYSFSVDQHNNINSSFFIFMIYQPMNIFLKNYTNLKKSDYARLVYLSTFLERNDTRIKVSKRRFAKRADIKNILDIPDRTARDFLKRMEGNGLIFFDNKGHTHISESLFKNGRIGATSKERNFARIFIKNTQALYHQFKKGKAIEKLGVMYSLVPYLDLRFNVLCKNANSDIKNIEDLEPLTMSELAEILGYSDSYALKRSLRSLKVEIDGITFHAVAFHEVGELDNALITFSPFFIYRDMPIDFLTKETHLIFYSDLLRQLKLKHDTTESAQLIEHLEQVLNNHE